jgi:hypothetical protein
VSADERGAPLAGIRVVDLSRALAGPYATMMLGDAGAGVLKVEQPGTGDDSRGWLPFVEHDGEWRGARRSLLSARLAQGDALPPRRVDAPRLLRAARHLDGEVLVGPNAVLALAREGYRWRDVSPRDLRDALAWSGFLRFAARHWRTGVLELHGSLSRRAFVAAARRYVPDVDVADVLPAPSDQQSARSAR